MWSMVCTGIFLRSPVLLYYYVVTWSVQEYSCTVLCSPRSEEMPAEPEPFDLCTCSCISYLIGYLKPDLCKS